VNLFCGLLLERLELLKLTRGFMANEEGKWRLLVKKKEKGVVTEVNFFVLIATHLLGYKQNEGKCLKKIGYWPIA